MIATAIICTRNRYQDLLRCLESLARHLDVAQADAVEYLQTTSLKFDGIFCGHVIEHLSAERGESLIKAGAAALRSNGVRIVVTDDPGAWRTLADWFWRDLTHVRFYPLSLLRELFEHQGFRLLACGSDPDTLIPKHGWRDGILRTIRRTLLGKELFDSLYGAGSIFIVGEKR